MTPHQSRAHPAAAFLASGTPRRDSFPTKGKPPRCGTCLCGLINKEKRNLLLIVPGRFKSASGKGGENKNVSVAFWSQQLKTLMYSESEAGRTLGFSLVEKLSTQSTDEGSPHQKPLLSPRRSQSEGEKPVLKGRRGRGAPAKRSFVG